MTTQHTVESLMSLAAEFANAYSGSDHSEFVSTRAALSTAITEVLAERDTLATLLDEATLCGAAEIERYRAIERGLSTCKRMSGASTAEDWKRIAEHLEWQWSNCSTFANKVAGERDTLAAKVAALEAQQPVAMLRTKGEVRAFPIDAAYELDDGDYYLVLAPGAAPKEPEFQGGMATYGGLFEKQAAPAAPQVEPTDCGCADQLDCDGRCCMKAAPAAQKENKDAV